MLSFCYLYINRLKYSTNCHQSVNYGYGIAISGGNVNGAHHHGGDACIYVSDIVRGGPADGKLLCDDTLLSVNGVNVENVEHAFVIRLLKEAKEFIHLVVRRKLANPFIAAAATTTPATASTTSSSKIDNSTVGNYDYSDCIQQQHEQQQHQHIVDMKKRQNEAIQHTANTLIANYQRIQPPPPHSSSSSSSASATHDECEPCIADPVALMSGPTVHVSSLKPLKLTLTKKEKKEPFGVVLGCRYYVKEIVEGSVAASEATLRRGDIVLKINDLTYDHVSLYQANKILAKCKDTKLNLVVKRRRAPAPPGDNNNNGGGGGTMKSASSVPNGLNMRLNWLDDDDDDDDDDDNDDYDNDENGAVADADAHEMTNTKSSADQCENGDEKLTTTAAAAAANENTSDQAARFRHPSQLFHPIEKKMATNPADQLHFYADGADDDEERVYRTAVFARENGIGIRLSGGNRVGIFICDVQYGSPSEKAGLRVADKIVSVNGHSYASLTREQAVHHILSIHTLIEMVVVYSKRG